MTEHPNILLITTDQQSATMLSCSGNPHLQTPHIDGLARDGVRCERAYAAQPLCVPQRNSWYTGLMPHQHGITYNRTDLELDAEVMLGALFRAAGYATGYSGKWHVNIPESAIDRHGFEWMNNIRCNGADVGIAMDFQSFLNERSDERPFLFSASFNNPHNICEAARGGPYPDGNPGMFTALDQLPPLPDNFAVPDREPTVIRQIQHQMRANNYPTADWDETRWRLHRWQYCRMVEMIDQHVGKLLAILDEHGLTDTTRILFTSDHGEGDAHHQWNQKQSLYDESSRVPFILTRPGSNRNQVDQQQLINNGIDLLPTLCGMAGIAFPKHLPGIDWAPLLTDPDLPRLRDHLIAETEFCTFNATTGIRGRMLRTDRFKYTIFDRGDHREFLADMVHDAGETRNLSNDVDHAAILVQHRDLLRQAIKVSEDPFPLDLIPG